MSDKLIQSYVKGFLGRTALSLLLSVAVVLFFGCLCAGLALIPERLLDPDAKGLLIAATIPCFGVTFTVGLVAVVLLNNRRVYAQFDQAFTPLGLTRSRYLLSGLQYQGTYRGRQVNVYYHVSGRRYFRAPNLEIYLNANFRTRLGIGAQNALSSLGGALMQQQALDPGDPAYEGLLIYPLDANWSRGVLGDAQARDSIVRLVGKDTPGVRGLRFSPDSLCLQLRHFSLSIISPESVRQWMSDLIALTEIAEGQPPATQTAESSDWERAGRSDRSRFLLPALGIVLLLVLCPVGLAGCVGLIAFLSAYFS
jgi:hypothetical protein